MVENIGDSYTRASDRLKRVYLKLFFSNFAVKDKKVVNFELTKEALPFVNLRESVLVSPKQLPD